MHSALENRMKRRPQSSADIPTHRGIFPTGLLLSARINIWSFIAIFSLPMRGTLSAMQETFSDMHEKFILCRTAPTNETCSVLGILMSVAGKSAAHICRPKYWQLRSTTRKREYTLRRTPKLANAGSSWRNTPHKSRS